MKINKNHFQQQPVDEFPTISPPLFDGLDDYITPLHADYFPFTFNDTQQTLTPNDIPHITDYTININDGTTSMTINFSNRRSITTHDRQLMQYIINDIDRRTIPWNLNRI